MFDNKSKKIRNLVTGGAGFLGSHLIDKLMNLNQEVICLDNYFTGSKSNIKQWLGHPNFEIIRHDVTEPIQLEVDQIWHLACPASPIHYQENPIKTAKTSFLGTYNMLGLARRVNARFLLASTSEVYGNPKESPQSESYHGYVNPVGPRSCYDEGKRVAETLCSDYQRIHNLDIRIMRIFNTYGPRMKANDGRVVSNLICQALQNKPLTIYGDGLQTRSFCYVDDLIDGMFNLMKSNTKSPTNIGNPEEITILELAKKIKEKINPKLEIVFKPLPQDDPLKRQPDIMKAKSDLRWWPKISLDNGLDKTVSWFKNSLDV
tara:strand:+ start:6776 stop:7729 length:954 start_codon:yes stop_codon:yes gene_type:complete